MIRIALLALITGVTLPLLVQLFLTLRALRRTADVVERRLDQTLRDIGAVVADLKRTTAGPSTLGGLVAAAAPVVVAAVRAFRTSMHEQHAAEPSDAHTANHPVEKETTP